MIPRRALVSVLELSVLVVLAALLASACDSSAPNDADITVDAGADAGDAAIHDGGPVSAFDGTIEEDAGPPLVLPVTEGLVRTAQVELPRSGPHLGEVTLFEDVVLVANSWDMLGVYLREPDGGLLVTLPAPPWPDDVMSRCTTLAIHAPSRSLYCASDEAQPLIVFDLSDPERPVVRERLALSFVDGVYARDIHVVGDDLYLARFDRGLWVAPIDPATGALGEAVQTAIPGNVRMLSGGAGDSDAAAPFAALTADRGLLLLAGEGADIHVDRSLALPGTPQDLSVRGTHAAVALGSDGAVVIDLAARPLTIVHHVIPPAVATSADVRGVALAVATLTGAYLYDVSSAPPRLAGFVPSGQTSNRAKGVMLSARITDDGDLVASDWTYLDRMSMDVSGHALAPDLPHGLALAPDSDLTLAMRSVSDVDVRVTARAGPTTVEAMLAAGAEARVTLDAASIAAVPVLDSVRPIVVQAFLVGGTPAFYTTTVGVHVRPPFVGEVPYDHPAPGDRFPTIAYASATFRVVHIPASGFRERIMFFRNDCAAMWPVLEDAAYLSRTHRLDDGATALLLNSLNIARDGWAARWGLWGVPIGHYGYLAPPEVIAENGSETVYDDRFMHRELPSAAAHPTDYLVDETGVVEAVETFYRGAFPLR